MAVEKSPEATPNPFQEWRKRVEDGIQKITDQGKEWEEKMKELYGAFDELVKLFSEFVEKGDDVSAIEAAYTIFLKSPFFRTPKTPLKSPRSTYYFSKSSLLALKQAGRISESELAAAQSTLMRLRAMEVQFEHSYRATDGAYERAVLISRLMADRLQGIRQIALEKQDAALNKSIRRFTFLLAILTVGLFVTSILTLARLFGLF